MPRKSAAALSVLAPPQHMRRPEPPVELTDEEAEEWLAVVHRLPSDWFPRETHQLLVQYCRHVVKARVIADWINDLPRETGRTPEGALQFDKLFVMAEREARAMSSLATRMRLTQLSRWQPPKAAGKAAASDAEQKPWKHVA